MSSDLPVNNLKEILEEKGYSSASISEVLEFQEEFDVYLLMMNRGGWYAS